MSVQMDTAFAAYATWGHKLLKRVLLGVIIGLALGYSPSGYTAAAASAFSFATVRDQARALAEKDYRHNPGPDLPAFLKELNYDQYQSIYYRSDRAPWQKDHLKFALQFFHRGYIYQESVRLHLIENGQVSQLPFSPEQFNYGNVKLPKPVGPDLGFAGFRILYAPGPDQLPNKIEVASFLGASYFRLVGTRQRYGATARGLALDTGEPGGEEFPR
ncbi:MAG TPA: glucan biosynthesis protein, partial [Clostridia bacterium]|nr:glucan biosynthesis protein [Clostridia bacterium]